MHTVVQLYSLKEKRINVHRFKPAVFLYFIHSENNVNMRDSITIRENITELPMFQLIYKTQYYAILVQGAGEFQAVKQDRTCILQETINVRI